MRNVFDLFAEEYLNAGLRA